MPVPASVMAERPAVPGAPRITRRALQADAKEARRQRILAAAEQVLSASPQREIGVAEVAEVAELAKGTVYLYFPSKDELLLAVHERQVEQFFGALSEAAAAGPLRFDDILQLIDHHTLSSSTYLPLATRCLTSLASALPETVRGAYRSRIAGHLARVGEIIEGHFHGLEPGGGVSLLLSSYALIMGMWQLIGPDSHHPYPLEFRRDLEAALRALWGGRIAVAFS